MGLRGRQAVESNFMKPLGSFGSLSGKFPYLSRRLGVALWRERTKNNIALVTPSMAEERVMGCTDKNGIKINIYTRNSKKKMLQRSNVLKILGGRGTFSQGYAQKAIYQRKVRVK